MRGIRLLSILIITAMMLVTTCGAAQCSFTCGPAQYGIGDVVSGDIWEAKVVSVEKKTTIRSNYPFSLTQESWSTKEGYSFLVVEVLINNTSAESQEYHSNSISLTDSEKRVYTPVGYGYVSGNGVRYDLEVTWTTTMPGPGKISDKTSNYIVFLVPDDAEGFYFKFRDLSEIYLGQ